MLHRRYPIARHGARGRAALAACTCKDHGIDTRAAAEAPGVLAVLTAQDVKTAGFSELPVPSGLKRRDGSPQYMPRYPILAEETVRWVGDPVAFVVAESSNQAMDAAELIAVDYEVLPAVTSTADASNPGAPRVWSDCPDNICFVEQMGGKTAVDDAFAKAAHIVKQRFVINRVTAAPMEPRGVVGEYFVADRSYTVHTAMQRPHLTRADLSRVLGVPESKLRVVTGDTGGSFGMKSPIFNETPLVLLAAKITGRPVKWISTRSEGFLSDAQGRDHVTEAELALDNDGVFLALRVKTHAAIGAYLQPAMPAFVSNAGTLAGVYRTPAIHVDITGVFSNTNPMRPYRGNGRPEAAYVIERMVDIAADRLKIDPAELRRRNYIAPDQMPFKTGLTFTYDSGEFEKNMDLALDLAAVENLGKRKAEAKARGKLLGFGLSNTIERAGIPSLEGAELRFQRDGSVIMFSGSNTQGQGHETALKQIVCDRLGLDPKEVQYVQGDTDAVFYGEGTGGSRSSTLAGSAVYLATEKVVRKATAIFANMLKVDQADLKFSEGVFSTANSNRTLTIKELAGCALDPRNLPQGMEPSLTQTAIYSAPVSNFPNGCHICEVEIDRETGKVNITRYSVVDDFGTMLNPLIVHGQVHGGVAQGVGQALMEDIHFDADGQLVTGSFMDYAMPRAHDMSAIMIKANPVPTKTNPLGVKGAGEAGCVGALPAVINAVIDALSEFGVTHLDMPVTPERVWRALNGR